MLKIKNLSVEVEKREILKGINLSLKKEEVHFLMGPNGAGKSTLGYILMGHPDYKVKEGSVSFLEKNILKLSPDKRAKLGLFLAFQNPVEFEGIEMLELLKRSLSSVSKNKTDIFELQKEVVSNLKTLRMKSSFMKREVNFGFSGGEKKKSEVLQLLTLRPKLAILDEIDSGLDIDSLKATVKAILKLKKSEKSAFLVITHLPRIAKYLKPDFVHIMIDGKIVKSGKKDLLKEIEQKGYKSFG